MNLYLMSSLFYSITRMFFEMTHLISLLNTYIWTRSSEKPGIYPNTLSGINLCIYSWISVTTDHGITWVSMWKMWRSKGALWVPLLGFRSKASESFPLFVVQQFSNSFFIACFRVDQPTDLLFFEFKSFYF